VLFVILLFRLRTCVSCSWLKLVSEACARCSLDYWYVGLIWSTSLSYLHFTLALHCYFTVAHRYLGFVSFIGL